MRSPTKRPSIHGLSIFVFIAIMVADSANNISLAEASPTRSTVTINHLTFGDLSGLCDQFNNSRYLKGVQNIYSSISCNGKLCPAVLTQRYYAVVGTSDNVSKCEPSAYLNTLNADAVFVDRKLQWDHRREIDFVEPSDGQGGVEHYSINFSSDDFDMRKDAPGCPLALQWIEIDGKQFTILSIVRRGDRIVFHDRSENAKDKCLYLSRIPKDSTALINHDVELIKQREDERYAIAVRKMPIVFLIAKGEEFACLKGTGVFDRHLIVEKDYYNRLLKEPLVKIVGGAAGQENVTVLLANWLTTYSNQAECH